MAQAIKPFEMLTVANVTVLKQGMQLLQRLNDAAYARRCDAWQAASVGSHLRHCLDSYGCFLQGIETGLIDYDLRTRDERLERDRDYAQSRIAIVITAFCNLHPDLSATVLQARQDSPFWAVTSVERELQFLLSHTVHHYALIALLLRAQGFELEADFGVAPSTLAYWQTQKSQQVAATHDKAEAAGGR